jgi:hypothetical protein
MVYTIELQNGNIVLKTGVAHLGNDFNYVIEAVREEVKSEIDIQKPDTEKRTIHIGYAKVDEDGDVDVSLNSEARQKYKYPDF